MNGRRIRTVSLDNGLAVEFWDASRPTAGDRWFVGVHILAAVPLTDEGLEEPLREIFRLVKQTAGDTIYYHRLEERHFVPADAVEKNRSELMEVFLENSLGYLSHPDFAGRFIRKALQEVREKKDWPAEQVQRVMEGLKRPGV